MHHFINAQLPTWKMVVLSDYVRLGYAVIRVDVTQREVDEFLEEGIPSPNHPSWHNITPIYLPDNQGTGDGSSDSCGALEDLPVLTTPRASGCMDRSGKPSQFLVDTVNNHIINLNEQSATMGMALYP